MDETLNQTMELAYENYYLCVCVCECIWRLYIQKSSFALFNGKSPRIYSNIVVLVVDDGWEKTDAL